MKKLFLILLGFTVIGSSCAQKQFNNWYLGYGAGITFNTPNPSIITPNPMYTDDNSATVSDSGGNLLFFANGNTAYDRNRNIMPNGSGLLGNVSGGQTATIVQKPGSSNLYYLFTVDAFAWSNGIKYSVVDLSLNGGMGDIVSGSKNINILAPATEKIVPIRHANGVDAWIVIHEWGTDVYRAYLLTASGLSTTPVINHIGGIHTGGNPNGYNAPGQITINCANNKIAAARYSDGVIDFFDFDNNTGVLSNFVTINQTQAWGAEFSPNGNLLYASSWLASTLYQYDLSTYTSGAITASQVNLGTCSGQGYLMLAPDDKIYIAKYTTNYLGVINNPNSAGTACNFVDQGFYTGSYQSSAGLADKILVNTCAFSVNLGRDTTLCVGQSIILQDTFANASYIWSMGATGPSITVTTAGSYWLQVTRGACGARDTINVTFGNNPVAFNLGTDTTYCSSFSRILSTGNANTLWSNGVTASQITVNAADTYWAEISNGCGTVRDSIIISQNAMPAVDLGDDTTLCTGDSLVLNAGNPGANYLWQDNSHGQTDTARITGTYRVSVTENGCVNSDSIRVVFANPNALIDLGHDSTICSDSTIILAVSIPGSSYVWSEGEHTPSIVVSQPGSYSVTVSTGCGLATGTVNIGVEPCTCRLAIPTAFSPNGDERNDAFGVVTACPIRHFEMNIYNRWGEKIFTSYSVSDRWNGTYRGTQQPIGVYVYVIHYTDPYADKEVHLSGNVTLLR